MLLGKDFVQLDSNLLTIIRVLPVALISPASVPLVTVSVHQHWLDLEKRPVSLTIPRLRQAQILVQMICLHHCFAVFSPAVLLCPGPGKPLSFF